MRHIFPTFLLLTVLSTLTGCQTTHRGVVPVSGGGQLYYEQRGSGEPLLLLHGHSLDRRMWDSQWKVFARDFCVIRPDFRGYGRSSEQREDLPMTHADDIITLLDSLHINQAHVVGLSMGAFVVGDLLAIYPSRLKSVTLASGSIRRSSPGPSQPMDSAESARRDEEIAALKQKGVEQMKREWIDALVASGGSRREQMRKPLERMIGQWSAWQPLHKEVRLFYAREAWDSLVSRRPKVPVLMLDGATEGKDSREPQELKYLENGQHQILPDCGHMMNMEQPELFNRIVLSFLKTASEKQ